MVSELDAESRARGRERALEARRERASIKRDVRGGGLSLADVLDRRLSDPVVARMKVVDLVESLPGVGPVRAAELLDRCAISPTRRLRGLGEHQVAGLLREFQATPRGPR